MEIDNEKIIGIIIFVYISNLNAELENGLNSNPDLLSPNGKFVLTISDYIAKVWDRDTGKCIHIVKSNKLITRAGFNSDEVFSIYHSPGEQFGFIVGDKKQYHEIKNDDPRPGYFIIVPTRQNFLPLLTTGVTAAIAASFLTYCFCKSKSMFPRSIN